jgi:hypothetical protein
MPTIVKPISVCAVLLLALSGCSKFASGQDEMSWARAALDRNDHLQVVAADAQARTFTVRVKDSGKLVVVSVDQVIAGPQEMFEAPAKPVSTDQQSATAPEAPGEAPATAPTSPAPAISTPVSAPAQPAPAQPVGPATVASAGDQAQMPGATSPGTSPSTKHVAPADADSAGYASAQSAPPSETAGPHADSARNAKAGSVLASGPGYSIKASGPSNAASPTRTSQVTASRGTPIERLHDPIVCQGSRLLHIDNRNLEFDGDAVSAEDGCEIHITNTHISAKGIGVLARAANVHIENSEIEGDSGAIDASDGAQVYATSSRFRGLNRRLESSAFHDLGGNVWN